MLYVGTNLEVVRGKCCCAAAYGKYDVSYPTLFIEMQWVGMLREKTGMWEGEGLP